MILGRLSLVDKALLVTVHSIERAEAVQKYFKDLLDNLHWRATLSPENVQVMMEHYYKESLPSVELLEAPDMITESLDQYYP
ncbi:hypothetical protein BJP43_05380 [Candidatus Williamhamiltonella defendens]|uniref:Uncharacterized protein n=1 Tax=Candidatus Williamhamiltonella defendens TaxID=138072 RepID=A0A2D3TDA4_9ENTR|nr:hypothetical protein BJP43_05380 [Candidatus Hamiltonella defensa]